MRTKHIDICNHFLRDMMEDKVIDIKYIRIEEHPAEIMTKNFLETDFLKHTKRIIEGELWEIVETRRENVKVARVMDDFIKRYKTYYSSHELTEVADGERRNDWILITIYSIGK